MLSKWLWAGRVLVLFGLVLWPGSGLAQFFDNKDFFDESVIDYEEIFKKGLSRNGTSLNLSGEKVGDSGVAALLSFKGLEKVTQLDLRYNQISEKGARLLAESNKFPRLKSLDLRHNFFLDSGAVSLANSTGFPNLQKLNLSFNEIRDQGALALGTSNNFPKLQKLDLRGNYLAGETKSILKAGLSHLRSLKLY